MSTQLYIWSELYHILIKVESVPNENNYVATKNALQQGTKHINYTPAHDKNTPRHEFQKILDNYSA